MKTNRNRENGKTKVKAKKPKVPIVFVLLALSVAVQTISLFSFVCRQGERQTGSTNFAQTALPSGLFHRSLFLFFVFIAFIGSLLGSRRDFASAAQGRGVAAVRTRCVVVQQGFVF